MKYQLIAIIIGSVALFGCGETFTVADDGVNLGGAPGTGSFSASGGGTSSGSSAGSGSTTSGGNAGSGGSASGGGTSGSGGTLSTGGSDNSTGGTATGGSNSGGTGGSVVVVTECTPGEGRCSTDRQLQTCSVDGYWVTTQTCPFACYHDDANDLCTGVCVPGATQCDVNGDVQTCNSVGQWEYMAGWNCPYSCTNGACSGQANICTPNSKQCAGSTPQTCKADGSAWVSGSACSYVCSAGACTGVCTPGATDCSGNTPRTCNASGQWVSGSACPFSCSAGACVGSCTPGSMKCNGSGTQTCQGDYTWGSTVSCPALANETASCSGAGVCGKSCNAGRADCNGGVDGCEADLSTTATCGSCGNTCNSAPAHAAPICSNSTSCSFVCNAGWADLNGDATDGCEGDIYTDPENCGSKGHSCGGTSCNSGVCAYTNTSVLVSSTTSGDFSNQIMGYTVSRDTIYYALNDNSNSTFNIYKVGLDGTGNTFLFNTAVYPAYMLIGGNYLLIQSQSNNGTIKAATYNNVTGVVINTSFAGIKAGGVAPVYGDGYFYVAVGTQDSCNYTCAQPYYAILGDIYQYDPVYNSTVKYRDNTGSYTNMYNYNVSGVVSMYYAGGRLYYGSETYKMVSGVFTNDYTFVNFVGYSVGQTGYFNCSYQNNCNYSISSDWGTYYHPSTGNNLVRGIVGQPNVEQDLSADGTFGGPLHVGSNYIYNLTGSKLYERGINGGPGVVKYQISAAYNIIYPLGSGSSLSVAKATNTVVLNVRTSASPIKYSLVRIDVSE